jgi:ATP synthase protein I
MTESGTPTRTKQNWRMLQYTSVGIEMGVATLIGWWIGSWLDKEFDTYPWLSLVFLLIGVAAGFKGLFRAAKQSMREVAEEEAAQGQGTAPRDKPPQGPAETGADPDAPKDGDGP